LRKIKQLSPDVVLYTKSTSPDTKDKHICTYCKLEGHLEEQCWSKHGKRDFNKNKDKDSAVADKKPQATANLAKAEPLWMTLAGPDLALLDDTALNPEQALKSSAQAESDPSRDVFLDCACSRHVMNRKESFTTYLPLKEGACEVRGFNKSRAYANGVGNVGLPMRVPSGVRWITLQNVLHAEESANLVTQGRLIRLGLH
jgi:hypothetical protein